MIGEAAARADPERQRMREWQNQMAESDYTAAYRRGMAARAEKQRAVLRADPGLEARAVMVLGSGGVDRQLEAAGRRRDEMLAAERAGHIGHGRFSRIPVEG